MRNRVFFPQEVLDLWSADDRVELSPDELTLQPQGRKYKVVEAVRVLREVTGAGDPHELIGKVKSRAYLAEFDAEIMEGSMIIGDNAYDVIPGFVGAPASSYEEHQKTDAAAPASDEELILSFVTG